MSIRQQRAFADNVLLNGTNFTVDPAFSRAKAVAMSVGRFVTVHMNTEVKKPIRPNTGVLDLAGRTVVPGFIDIYGHRVLFCFESLASPWLVPDQLTRFSNIYLAGQRRIPMANGS